MIYQHAHDQYSRWLASKKNKIIPVTVKYTYYTCMLFLVDSVMPKFHVTVRF